MGKKYFLLAKRTHDKNIQKTPRSIYFKNDRNTHISKVILAHTHDQLCTLVKLAYMQIEICAWSRPSAKVNHLHME